MDAKEIMTDNVTRELAANPAIKSIAIITSGGDAQGNTHIFVAHIHTANRSLQIIDF